MGDKLNEWIDANSATLQALAGPGQPGIPPSAIPGMPGAPGAPQPGFPPQAPPPPAQPGFAGARAGHEMAAGFPAAAPATAPPSPAFASGGPMAPQAGPVDVQAPAQPAPKPKPKKKGDKNIGMSDVMKDADPKQIDEAIRVMEQTSGKSAEELYTQQTGAPPPEGMGKRKIGEALFEFGLNLMAAPAGLSDVETIGRAGQATIAGRRQREEKAEAKALATEERRAAAEERRLGRIDKQFDRAATLKRLEIEQSRLQAELERPVGPFKDYIGEDGTLYSRDMATGEARQVMHKGKPFRPDAAFMKSANKKLEWEIKKNGYMAVHGIDASGKPLTGAALRDVQALSLDYANSEKVTTETEARIKAHMEVSKVLKDDNEYSFMTPAEKDRILNEKVQGVVDFYMLRKDTLTGNKPDPSRLTEGVATPIKDPDTGVMEYWTLDVDGNAKQVSEQQVLQKQ